MKKTEATPTQTTTQAEIAIIVCGALAREVLAIARRHQWQVDLYALPAILHNTPRRIPEALARKLDELSRRYRKVIVGYGDCGTGGRLDALIARYPNVRRLPGPHCYEMYGGEHYEQQMAEKPGTFFLTDFLARSFRGLVWRGLGLDRYPELKEEYFRNYTDLVWLAQHSDARAHARAKEAAQRLGLPLTVISTGFGPLEERLRYLVEEWEPTSGGDATPSEREEVDSPVVEPSS